MDEKKISILVLMDMSKAFYSINHNMLLFILRSLGVSLLLLFFSFTVYLVKQVRLKGS